MKKILNNLFAVLTAVALTSNTICVFSSNGDLEGEGTKESPYLISDFDDYIALTAAVDSGENFKGKYFKQTADIKPEADGEYGLDSDDEFSGIYDGNGYTITIAAKDAEKTARKIRQGLFGVLTGVVMNLNVEGHMVNTDAGGIFAYEVKNSGKIVNCSFNGKMRSDYSKVPFYGLASTANYDGVAIINCYVFGMQAGTGKAQMSYPITDTQGTSKNVYFCINDENKNGYQWKNEESIDTSFGTPLEVSEMSAIAATLNLNIEDAAAEAGVSSEELLLWDLGQSAVTLYNAAMHTDKHYEPLIIEFNGEGTIDNPYLIENYSDYNKLTDYIKRGMSFENTYFKQISDITVSVASAGKTVVYGLSSAEKFAGIYDGDGHTIRLPDQHNSIAGTDIAKYGVTVLNQGLFGTLSGTVMNLNISGRVKNILPAGIIAYKVINGGKIVNCSFVGHIRNDLSGGNLYYGFASTEGYSGKAIVNCFYKGIFAGKDNTLYPITDTEGTYDNSYYCITDKNGDEISATACGTQLSTEEMKELYTTLNDNLLNCSALADVAAADLYKWKADSGNPVFSDELYTYVGIDALDKAVAKCKFIFTADTIVKKSDFVKVYFDKNLVSQYSLPIVNGSKSEYSKEVTVDAALVTEGLHTIRIELYSQGNLNNTVTKTLEANSVALTDAVFSGTVAAGNTVTFSADVAAFADDCGSAAFVIALFDKDNNMKHFNFVERNGISSVAQRVSVSLEIADDTYVQDGVLELYIWDSLGHMNILDSEMILWTYN